MSAQLAHAGFGETFSHVEIKSYIDWGTNYITGDWEVEWIKEPLKIETTVLVHRENEHCGKIIMEHELIGKRFKMVLVEIQEADHAE